MFYSGMNACSMRMKNSLAVATVAAATACPFGEFLINLPAIKFWCSHLSVSGDTQRDYARFNGTFGDDEMTRWHNESQSSVVVRRMATLFNLIGPVFFTSFRILPVVERLSIRYIENFFFSHCFIFYFWDGDFFFHAKQFNKDASLPTGYIFSFEG